MIVRNESGNILGVYESSSGTKKANEQRFQRILIPLLDELLDTDSPKEVIIDGQNQLCINGTPIGNYLYIAEFKVDTMAGLLEFAYRYKNSCRRIVDFGMPGFEKRDSVDVIFEIQKDGTQKVIYSA